MTIPPFLHLEVQLLEASINSQKKTNKEAREELRIENRRFLKSKIENLVKKKIQKPKANISEKNEVFFHI